MMNEKCGQKQRWYVSEYSLWMITNGMHEQFENREEKSTPNDAKTSGMCITRAHASAKKYK